MTEKLQVRLAEMVAAMSKATDLGMGQPVETALATCLVATRLAGRLGFNQETAFDTYYLSLLRFIGCNAETQALAAVVGDELALRRDFALLDPALPALVADLVARYVRALVPDVTEARLAAILGALPEMMGDSFRGHCEVAQRLAERMRLPASLITCLGQIYERWDGRGHPRGLRQEEVARPVLAVALGLDAVLHARLRGTSGAVAAVRARARGAYPEEMAACFEEFAPELLAGLDTEPTWRAVLELEPGARRVLDEDGFDRCCEALAAFADLKSPFLAGHSLAVADLVDGAAARAALPQSDARDARRAALLHEIGRAGLSSAIWAKPAPLSEREWEQVRLHPYHTERILARPEGLRRLGRLASLHRERLDGSGYPHGVTGSSLSPAARLLAAADAYQSMIEPRPHRPPLPRRDAALQLQAEARAGALDRGAVAAVLAASGVRVGVHAAHGKAGLTAREVEVLRLLARGHTNAEVGARLHISLDTVKRHVQHVYQKAGVSTRAAATLFAVESALL